MSSATAFALSDRPIHTTPYAERRSHRRYEVEMELRYELRKGRRWVHAGSGKIRNISTTGALFEADQILPEGAMVRLSVNWPVRLQNFCALTLVLLGSVVHSEGREVAIKTDKYEFRTRGDGDTRNVAK